MGPCVRENHTDRIKYSSLNPLSLLLCLEKEYVWLRSSSKTAMSAELHKVWAVLIFQVFRSVWPLVWTLTGNLSSQPFCVTFIFLVRICLCMLTKAGTVAETVTGECICLFLSLTSCFRVFLFKLILFFFFSFATCTWTVFCVHVYTFSAPLQEQEKKCNVYFCLPPSLFCYSAYFWLRLRAHR